MVTPTETPIPQAVDAEQSVLGAMLISAKALLGAKDTLHAEDFYQPRNKLIFAAICDMTEAGKPADAVTVAAELLAQGVIGKVGGHAYLHELMSTVPTAANWDWYADEVRKTARRRKVIQACTRAIQAASTPTSDDTFLDVAAASALQIDLVIDEKPEGEPVTGLSTWAEFVADNIGKQTPTIVPGLINQGDVFMILAPPGAGKTTLSRQVVWTIAAGIHPFDWALRIEPKRTLLIDLEVDPTTTAEESEMPLANLRRIAGGDIDDQRAWIWSHPQGLNLRKREDAQLLERVIEQVRPDFVALGSLYKTGVQARGGESYEVAANEVREVFDRLRRRWRFALWIEHHMPKAQDGGRKPNPFGSSVWEWWPSHGRVLERCDGKGANTPFRFAQTFRGDRGKREIPVGFQRGGRLPWTAIWEDAELELLVEAAGGKS